jgi:hypothetical protein
VVSFARKVNGVPKAFEKNSNDKSFLPCNLNGNEKKRHDCQRTDKIIRKQGVLTKSFFIEALKKENGLSFFHILVF